MEAVGDPAGAYAECVAAHGHAHETARSRSSLLGNLRLATFVGAGAALIGYDLLEGTAEAAALLLAALLVLAFLAQIVVHRRARALERWEGALLGVFEEGLLRLRRDWEALDAALPEAERAEEPVDARHAYAVDLDVTGPASLVRLCGPVTSERGRRILRVWLHGPATPDEVRSRQGAVRELAGRHELRAAFTAHGRLEGPDALEGIEAFLQWAEEGPWILGRPWMRVAGWVLPLVLLAAVLGDVLLTLGPWWLLPGLAQLEVFRRVTLWAQRSFRQAAKGGAPIRALVPQLELLAGQRWSEPRLLALEDRLGRVGSASAHRRLERLSGLLDTVESRRNMVYAALAPVLLLDVHLGVALDRWRHEHGGAVRDWLDASGEWEALSALSTLAFDHPDWAFPTFPARESEPTLEGRGLGHPLLPPDTCVRNDVSVGPPGTFLLVTGSNMSGKSTLLRALGVNAVLGLAGGPVCATALTLPPLRVRTSMRIDDSLSEGISLFMAELLRIRDIVRAADDGDRGATPVLFLLDEILHGTNTAERRVAARGVIRHLLAARAIGAVSTHDLTLADAADLNRSARAVHFREHVGPGPGGKGTRLTFDYTLRDGIATTSNALKLLEAVGLGDVAAEGEGS
jgi:hypothetical protein